MIRQDLESDDINKLNEQVRKWPDWGLAWAARARYHARQGDYARSVADWDKALELYAPPWCIHLDFKSSATEEQRRAAYHSLSSRHDQEREAMVKERDSAIKAFNDTKTLDSEYDAAIGILYEGDWAGTYAWDDDGCPVYQPFPGATDYNRAFPILLRLAEAGHLKSMAAVAECYDSGRGTARSPQKAAQWKERAERAGA